MKPRITLRLLPKVKPRRLHRGDYVSLVAPSGAASSPDRVDASIHALETLGLRVKVSPHCADAYGYLAGTDTARARELERAFLDPDTKAVVCLKGGYGTPRILDRIDYSIFADHPKIFLGYSDITALHTAFRQLAGLVTFHGPMPSSDMVPGFDPESRASLEGSLFGSPTLPSPISNPSGGTLIVPPGAPHSVRIEGELVGGNLSLIAATMGTAWELDTEGKIIFLEDIDETPYRIDRMLNQLRLAGKFEACAGILVGSWTRCEPQGGKPSLSIDQIFGDLVIPCGKPILSGLEAGHGSPALTLALGVRYSMDVGALSVEMLESPYAD